MRPLDAKLFRGLWHLRGQVLAIALVIASSVATLFMAIATAEALRDTTETYYQRYRFADVFATVVRAPDRIAEKISRLPGVQMVDKRISQFASVDVTGFDAPIIGQLVSIPKRGQPALNQLVLRKGAWISPNRDDEVIVNEPFADAHKLALGDRISVVLEGKKKSFEVVGIALSPEFIYALGPGALLPDDHRFGVLWIAKDALAAAYDLKDSFNNLSLSVAHNTDFRPILESIDRILAPYGGASAVARKDQLSNWFVMNEIEQQKSMATILPSIFISVAIFLTYMVLSRLIATERTEIGLLKAFGYSSQIIAWHYIKLVLVIGVLGIILGGIIGWFFGRINIELYAETLRFPLLIYRPSAFSFVLGAGVSLLTALLGALTAVGKAIKLPPAEAMQPPSPPVYKSHIGSESWSHSLLDQPTRIALRQIIRWPFRSFLTSCGIGFAVGLSVMTMQWSDSLDHMANVYFFEAQRQDVMVGLANPASISAVHDLAHLPGVQRVEPMRFVVAEFTNGSLTHRGSLSAIKAGSKLQPIYDDAKRKVIPVPQSGITIARSLADKLGVKPGDIVWVEILQGRRPNVALPVENVIETFIGLPAFISFNRLNDILKEGTRMGYANLLVDPAYEVEFSRELKDTPNIGAIMHKQAALDSFNRTVVNNMMIFIMMFSILAGILAFGITYNSARIALSERGRELATLRVLGFSRGEISYVLLGEVVLLIILGLPLGCILGWGLVLSLVSSFDTEVFRIPMVILPDTFGYSVLLVVAATALTAAMIRRRVDKLDLIKVLKTRE
jgi:putative ABC transport system permease protein